MVQGLLHNPNVAPSSYPTKFRGLFGKVAWIQHPTQQNFVICLSAKMDTSHWLRHIWQYLNQYPPSSNDTPVTCTSCTYKFIDITHFPYKSLGMCYQRYTTMGKNAHIAQQTSSMGVMRYLYQFQLSHHKMIIMTTSLHICSIEKPGLVIFKPQDQKTITASRKRTHLPYKLHPWES